MNFTTCDIIVKIAQLKNLTRTADQTDSQICGGGVR